uniref:Dynein light intermediate chain n=1 Tax=Amphimedon queenslandica TaxID=400682 RepID=A0A1X7T2D2_AMPQE
MRRGSISPNTITSLYIMDTLGQESVSVIQRCPLCGARLGMWNLDGVVWHSQLLPFVLHERNVTDTLVMIVVDLSKPWAALESMERWSEV